MRIGDNIQRFTFCQVLYFLILRVKEDDLYYYVVHPTEEEYKICKIPRDLFFGFCNLPRWHVGLQDFINFTGIDPSQVLEGATK